jgi:hypothetical protein
MARPGAEDILLDLILDYRNNVALYQLSSLNFASIGRRYLQAGFPEYAGSPPRYGKFFIGDACARSGHLDMQFVEPIAQ